VGVGGYEPKGQAVVGGSLDLTAMKCTAGVAIDEQAKQHAGAVGGAAPLEPRI
jgi:hypothetical protein